MLSLYLWLNIYHILTIQTSISFFIDISYDKAISINFDYHSHYLQSIQFILKYLRNVHCNCSNRNDWFYHQQLVTVRNENEMKLSCAQIPLIKKDMYETLICTWLKQREQMKRTNYKLITDLCLRSDNYLKPSTLIK